MKARVTVYPRPEILDPEGKAIREALGRLGFDQVHDVRAGRSYDIEIDAPDAVTADAMLRRMCEKLLANTVVEDYEVEVVSEASETTEGDSA